MSKGPSIPVYRFTVFATAVRDLVDEYTVTACYFQEQGAYTVLKDAEHAAVSAFKTDSVLRIMRAEKPLEFV